MTTASARRVIILSPARHPDGRTIHGARGPLFDARLQGRTSVLVRSHQPLFDGARRLMQLGLCMPEDTIAVRHISSSAISIRMNAGLAAKLSIEENCARCPTPRKWKPMAKDNEGGEMATGGPVTTS